MKKNIYKLLKNEKLVEELLTELIKKCIQAAKLDYKNKISYKADGTAVTRTDYIINDLIIEWLNKYFSNIPIISEEKDFKNVIFLEKLYWIIDPIDGTSSFIRGEDNYTVNVALIENGFPKLGIIGHPPTNTIWYGSNNIATVNRNGNSIKIKVSKFNNKNIRVLLSSNPDRETLKLVKKMDNAFIEKYSSSIKFCKLAEGKADIYPRLQSINKWDIAAGDAILTAAGGKLFNHNGKKFQYNYLDKQTGPFFAATSEKYLTFFVK